MKIRRVKTLNGTHRRILILAMKEETNLKIKWPAIMFAASRMARVKGRIASLTVSTRAKNKARPREISLGEREARSSDRCFLNIKINQPDHNVNPHLRVTDGYPVGVNTQGKRPLKFSLKMKYINLEMPTIHFAPGEDKEVCSTIGRITLS